MADSPEMLRYHIHILVNLLQDLGFILNTKKCVLEPSQLIEYLGFLVNSHKMELFLPQEKLDNIGMPFYAKEGSFISKRPCPPNWLTNGDNSHLPSSQRLKHRAVSKSQYYYEQIELDMDVIKDLQFWTTQVHRWNGRPINLPIADLH